MYLTELSIVRKISQIGKEFEEQIKKEEEISARIKESFRYHQSMKIGKFAYRELTLPNRVKELVSSDKRVLIKYDKKQKDIVDIVPPAKNGIFAKLFNKASDNGYLLETSWYGDNRVDFILGDNGKLYMKHTSKSDNKVIFQESNLSDAFTFGQQKYSSQDGVGLYGWDYTTPDRYLSTMEKKAEDFERYGETKKFGDISARLLGFGNEALKNNDVGTALKSYLAADKILGSPQLSEHIARKLNSYASQGENYAKELGKARIKLNI